MNRKVFLLLTALFLLVGSAFAEITSVDQLKQPGIKVGTELGCAAEQTIRKELPDAKLEQYNDKNLGYLDVANGRLDAFIYERRQMELALQGGVKGVRLLDENIDEAIRVAVGISPVSGIGDLKGKINEFIAGLRADGTLDDMLERWVDKGWLDLPRIDLPDKPALHLTVGTTGIVPPYSFYLGDELRGFDIELAYRLAAWLGADLEFKVYDYGAIVPAAISGDVDCIMANLNVTPERAEALPFSDTLYESKMGVMVKGEAKSGLSTDFSGSVGVQTGTNFDGMVMERLPQAKVEYYNTKADLIAALTGHKIDACAVDEPVAQLLMREDDRLTCLPDYLDNYAFAFVFPKNETGAALRDLFNSFLESLRSDGTLDQLAVKWFGEDEEAKTMPDLSALSAPNGTLRMATEAGYAPFEYVRDGAVVGYDAELAARFCEACGYGLEIVDMNFDGILPSVQAGKCDFAGAGISITPEREESVFFSEPNYAGGTVLMVLKGEEDAAPGVTYNSLSQLVDKRIGIPSGTSFDLAVQKTFPGAKLFYYNNQSDLLMALTTDKIDAFPSDEPVIRYIMGHRTDVTYIPEYLETFEFAYCFPKTEKGRKLRDEMSEFIADLKARGGLQELSDKWFGADESIKTIPDLDALPAKNGTLVMATDGDYMPFEYVRDGKVVGYDVDIAAQFCEAYGYALAIEVMNLDAVLPAVQSGKCSFGGSAITITPEREESVLFSEPNYTGGTVMVVLQREASPSGNGEQEAAQNVRWQDYNGKRLGVLVGPLMEDAAKKYFPDSEYLLFNGYQDCITALRAGKIDAYLGDEPGLKAVHREQPDIDYIHDRITQNNYSFAFRKNDPKSAALCNELNAFLEKSWRDGTMQELEDIWFGNDEDRKVVDMSGLTGENGTIRVVTTSTDMPFSYIKDGANVGYDIDLVVRFCRDRGYALELGDVDFDGRIPAIESGKYDFTTDMNVTRERQEQVLFSSPTSYGGIVLGVLAKDLTAPVASQQAKTGENVSVGNGFAEIVASFNKTFVRENRWKLFLSGVLTTLLITVLSILFGTTLGFAVFMLCRNGNPVANLVTRFCLWLVQGMPMVVLLMILYYVIFGSVAINGVVVAVIGFTLTFGAAVYGLLKMGVGAVEVGQYEAAYALGYSNRRTFFKIILPQALPHVLPAYRGEIVSLIKATAIVGYIAVQDLTKMGDIVRSRTYEAFFPLIAVTVIYFVLEGLIGFCISRISVNINPKRRKPAQILKGVKTDDQN